MSDDIADTWRALVAARIENRRQPGSAELWSPGLETLSPEALVRVQSEKIRAAYGLLFARSAFYRAKFAGAGLDESSVTSVDTLHRVPLTHPSEWMEDQESTPPWGTFSPLRDEDWKRRGWMVFTTSGTKAAHPRAFRHTTFDRDLWSWHGVRALYAMGVRPGDVALNCTTYGMSVAFWGLHHALNDMGVPVLSGGGATTERRVEIISRFSPTVLLATPSYALHLGRTMNAMGRSAADSSIRRVVVAGEPGASVPSTRARLRELWGAHVHDDFGCTEVAMSPLGYTCRASESLDAPSPHLMEDQYVVEALSPSTWKPVPDGELGVLVVSNLFSEAQPILRYVMGDWVRLTREPCACGRTHARALGGLLGRYDDVIKVKGLKFHPAVFEDAVRAVPCIGDEFKVELRRDEDTDVILVTVEPAEGVLPAEVSAEVERRIRATLGVGVVVCVVARGALPRPQGKVKRFFDLRKQGDL